MTTCTVRSRTNERRTVAARRTRTRHVRVRRENEYRASRWPPGRRRTYYVEISTSDAHRTPITDDRRSARMEPRSANVKYRMKLSDVTFFPIPCKIRRARRRAARHTFLVL